MAFKPKTSLKLTALSSVAAIALTLGAPAAFADPVQFNIEQGATLQVALNEFARQADTQIIFSSGIVNGKAAPALVGAYEPEAGLEILLAGSGLEFSQGASGALLIAQAGAVQSATPVAAPGEPVSVEGTVRGAITDSNLAGARVEIVETGQVTATDNLGRFRFPAVSPGRYTLRISYLGRETIEQAIDLTRGDFSQSFAMGFPASMGVTSRVEVIGARSAREQALNQERSAANTTTVITADQLGTFNGTTVSEALRRAPGIAFIPDDQTGDGANVIVRGIEPDLNQVQINGLRLLDGSGLGRSPDLSGILLENIESVTINKSLLPNQDSNGAGALIEIETKSPLDRDRRFASFNIEYGERGNDFGEDLLIGGTISGTFGSDDTLGLSLSGSYRENSTTRVNYSVSTSDAIGRYFPLDESGEPISRVRDIDPRTPFPFELGANEIYPSSVTASQGGSDVETLSLTGTVEKQWRGHTNLRFDATYTSRESGTYNASTIVGGAGSYSLAPISPGGEERFHYVSEEGFSGTIFGSLLRQARYAPGAESDSVILSFRGDTNIGQWAFTYSAGFTESKNASAPGFEVFLQGVNLQGPVDVRRGPIADQSFLTQEALNNVTGDGRLVSLYAPLIPGDDTFVLPLFNQAAFDFYNDINLQPQTSISERQSRRSNSSATTFSGSARRDFSSGILTYVEIGFTYQDTEFFSPSDGARRGAIYDVADGRVLSETGLSFGPGILTQVGAANELNSLTRNSVIATAGRIASLVDQGILISDGGGSAGRSSQERTTGEEALSSYLQARVDYGDLEVVGGFRLEHLDLSSTYFQSPSAFLRVPPFVIDLRDFGIFVSAEASQTDLLPRVTSTYRYGDNLVLRGAYYRTASQPQLRLLTSLDDVFYNGFANRLQVTRGNPELKPATTDNFSADVEYYTDNAGVFSLSVFHKRIKNALQTTFTEGEQGILPEDFELPEPFQAGGLVPLPDDVVFLFRRPINSDSDSTLWGIELNAEQRLNWLPSPLDGVGVLANYTYTQSERPFRQTVPTSVDPAGFITLDLPFGDSPENQGTLGLTYSKYGIDGSLLYTYQDRRLSAWNAFGLSNYSEAFDTLDLQVSYVSDIRGRDVRVFFRGNDLLRGNEDPFLQSSRGGADGVPKFFTGGTYFGGRSFEAGLSVTF